MLTYLAMTSINLRSCLLGILLMALIIPIVLQIKEKQFFTTYLRQRTLNQHEININVTLEEENRIEINRSSGEENKEQRLPTALIIGVKKGGTGTLHHMLNKHPDIVVAKGEPRFFKMYGNGDLERYKRMMPYSHPNQVTIDSSAGYFIYEAAPERIYRFNKTIRLVLIIRDPITRFISDYAHMSSISVFNNEEISIDDVVQNKEHNKLFHRLLRPSYYQNHFNLWLKYFPRHQIHVVDGNKFIQDNPAKELRKVETFLKLNHYLTEDHFTFSPDKGFYCFTEDGQQKCMSSHKGRAHPNISQQSLAILDNLLRMDRNTVAELSASNIIQD